MIKSLISSLLITSFLLLAVPMSAQARDILGSSVGCNKVQGASSSAICTDNSSVNSNPSANPVLDKLKNITLIISFVAGAAAIILILIGSIQYIISDGDANKISSAKNTIIYALVGLLVVAMAATIIEFVVSKL